MNITILALGSRGDVVPYLSLGKGLKARGHQVRIATFVNFESLVAHHQLDFYPIHGDIQKILTGVRGLSMIDAGRNPARMTWSVPRVFSTMAEGFAQDLSTPVLQDSELIVNQLPGGMYGYSLSEQLGVPMVLAAVMPLTPSRYLPMLAFPSQPASIPGYNTLTHRLAYQLVWQWFRPAINRWRTQTLGLVKAPFWGYSRPMDERGIPVLNGFSAHVVPRPPDWGGHIHITGYWFAEDEGWQPPDNLRRFIETGPLPIYIGFGSMPIRDPMRTTSILLDALKLSGKRAVLQMGWGNLGQQELPDNVYKIEYAPHRWLFSRVSAVVHHGGSGTTAAGLRAGVPSVTVPFLFDQYYWGDRIHSLGVGPRPIPERKLTVERLVEALAETDEDTQMRQRASALGMKIRMEDGVGEAVEVILRHVRRSGS